LKIHINDFPVLIHGSPQVMLLAIDLHENFVDIEGIAVATMPSLQSLGIKGTELDAP